jgi:arylsulfatase A-like enzyme
MNRRDFITKSGMTGAAVISGASALFNSGCQNPNYLSRKDRPNLIFVFTDEHPAKGWSRGIKELKTPNLDRFAKQGVTVTNCVSNNPICVPYRATLFTGQHGHQTGFVNNHGDFPLAGDLPSWSKTLKSAGYTMGYVGKWHLYPGCEDPIWKDDKRDGEVKTPAAITPAPLRHGFDDLWIQTSNHNRPRNTYVWDKDGKYKQINAYAPEFLTDRFIEFMEENSQKDAPFCGVLSVLPPHPSYPGAKEHWVDYYQSIETPYWGNVPEEYRDERRMHDLKHFYAQISSVDEEFGRILDKIDELGIADNTIVIFTSDHGDLHYAHGVKWKRYPYEESILVPFIIRYPGKIPADKEDDLLLGSIDLAPTLLGLTGHGSMIDRAMQGMDLSKRLCTGRGKEPQSQFILFNLPEETHYIIAKQPSLMDYRGVRTKRWTFTLQKDPDTGRVHPWHLFDNPADPLQMNNLCDDPAYADIREELTEEIRKHLAVVSELEWLENKPKDRHKIPGTYQQA